MASRYRRDKCFEETFRFCFSIITSGLVCQTLFATSEPICYTRKAIDDRHTEIKQTDCDSADEVCKRFASRRDVDMNVLLNLPCDHTEEEEYPPTIYEESSTQNGLPTITCTTNNLPVVKEGSFDCPFNSNVLNGETCNMTCNDGFYSASSSQAVCEAQIANGGGKWSDGNFTCREINCSEEALPQVINGTFLCSPGSVMLEGGVCTLACLDDFYPFPSSQAVCTLGDLENGGEWLPGNFSCIRLDCKDWNEWRGSEYRFTTTEQTWENSSQLCANEGAHLITISDEEENHFVHQAMLKCNIIPWNGLTDLVTEGSWEWSDGTAETYRNWAYGYPSTPHYDCVIMSRNYGDWQDHPCQHNHHAVCERNKTHE